MASRRQAGWYTALCIVLLLFGIVSVLAGTVALGVFMIALGVIPLVLARSADAPSDAAPSGPAPDTEPGLMTVEEVAAFLDTTPSSILLLVARDSIPYVEPMAGGERAAFRFRRAEIEAWLRSDPYYVPPPAGS